MVELKYSFYNTIFLIIRTYFFKLAVLLLVLFFIDFEPFGVKFMACFYLLSILPALYLHFEYLRVNRNMTYQISESEIILIDPNGVYRYKVEDLKRIIVYMTPTIFKYSSFVTWPIEEYYYARIITTNGEEMIVSCLYIADIKKFEGKLRILKYVEFIMRKEIFCTLSLSYRG